MNSLLRVGIDVGSTTIKVVVLNKERKLVYKKYARHFSEINAVLKENLAALGQVVEDKKFSLAMTGSAGMGIAERIGLPFVQEVIACATAVRELIPRTDTVVELGGEDAKVTYFGEAPEQRMNGVCAGGTGSFIDQMASLLSTDAPGLNALAEKGKQIYTIASRCGVFAKTDIQALMNDGAAKADIALSIFQAVVNQTIGNLAQGRPIGGNVAFLGGPLHFLPELKKRFIETLKLTPERVVPVAEGNYFVAVGAALSEEAEPVTMERVNASVAKTEEVMAAEERKADFVLFENQADYAAFRERHDKDKVPRGDFSAYRGPVYLGIDAGSTTTKLAAVGRDKELLYTSYGSNHGSPLQTVVGELQELYKAMPEGAYIASAFTTGYGEAIVKAALHADGGEVETFAHLRAAQEFCPQVSFVLDIGGQDMKCFYVHKGSIGSIILNEACSAGCGSFIENFAQSLKLTAGEFAAKALESKAPVDLGTRCTVFMNSKVKQAQKDGAQVGDISAGIALSVIKNALFKVMQLKDVSSLGDNIVVQGGTFYNDAVLRSMELLLERNVIRPDIAGLMGAYGAAILALESGGQSDGLPSSILPAQELENFAVTTRSFRCHGCGNACLVTVQNFPDGGRYFTGNRCERGAGKEKKQARVQNIYKFKYDRLFNYYKPLAEAPRGKIGIPRVLNIYEDYPFWFTLLTRLGYQVVLSSESSAHIYYKGMDTVPSDSLCYPAKLAHGHIMDLVEQGVKKIFYPCLPYNMEDEENRSDNHFNCPVVASYAENIRGNMDVLREREIDFIQPFLPIHSPKHMVKRLYQELGDREGISKGEIKAACEAAYEELENYRQEVRRKGQEILREAEQTGRQVILLAGRPYHVDPEINHGIPEMIQSYDLPIISEDAVYHLPVHSEPLKIVNQWSYHARLYHAAHYVAEHDNVTMIQFSSFGCGLDAITTGQVKSILEEHERIYTMIKLDDVSNLGAARIRLRSLMAALARKKPVQFKSLEITERPHFTEECKHRHTILAPQMAPVHFELFGPVLQKFGYNVIIPPMPRSAVDVGLKYVNNDMCYPAIVVIGQLINAIQKGLCDPDNTSIMLFQTCGACRATNYINVMRMALKDAGYPQIPVFAVWGLETDSFHLDRDSLIEAIKAAVYGDVLMNVKNRTMPYELHKGETQAVYDRWMAKCKEELSQPKTSYKRFAANIHAMVQDFEAIPIDEDMWKPKVGIVGEILAKYHPVANNHIERVLMEEGAEVVMPDFVDFFMYSAYDAVVKRELLDGSLKSKLLAQMFIHLMEFYRRPVRSAMKHSRRYQPPHTIKEIAAMAKEHVSLGNMAGEGWFLTGEMVKLIKGGVSNVVCLQPFGCLPNHITGKGVIHSLRNHYRDANILAIDCDAGASEVNQLNRLKLMLSVAKEKNPRLAEGRGQKKA